MLVSMKYLLEHARDNKYIVAAPNVWNEWSTRATIDAAIELNSPIIIDYDFNSNIYNWMSYTKSWAEKAPVPVAINLDHGVDIQHAITAIHSGFSSVMLDRSSESFEKNSKDVGELVKIAKACDVTVEAELGYVGDASSSDQSNVSHFTKPTDVKRFVNETNVDCLAVAVGTAHGKYKEGFVPEINFELIKTIEDETDIPLVLHGGSGTPKEVFEKLAKETNISKVNLFTDIHDFVIDKTQKLQAELPLYEIDYHYYHAYKEILSKFIMLFNSNNQADFVEFPVEELYKGDMEIR